jgi:hypothetical protein
MRTTRRSVLEAALLGGVLGYGLPVDLLASPASRAMGPALEDSDRALLRAIADTIIPATESPAASAVGTVEFLEHILRRGMTTEARAAFENGLHAFAADCREALGNPFDRASAQQRFELLDTLDRALFSDPPDASRKAQLDFFATMKSLTVIGYYTSEKGAHAELDVQPFPGEFKGAAPIERQTRTFYEDSFGVPIERPVGYLKDHG